MDVTEISESSLAKALEERLYIDHLYEELIRRTVIPFSSFSSWFDRKIIDGIVRGLEKGSQASSQKIRLLTTGSTRDYILYATIGALSIIFLLMGVTS